jgi:hypothetical protein
MAIRDIITDEINKAKGVPTPAEPSAIAKENVLVTAVNRPVAEAVIFDYLNAKDELKVHQAAVVKLDNDPVLNMYIATGNLKAVGISKKMLDKSDFAALDFKDALADRPDYKAGAENERSFKYAELPMADLRELGLTPKQVVEHPEIGKLLKGQQTNDTRLYIFEDIKLGLGINSFDAKLSLERKPDNSVSLLIHPQLKVENKEAQTYNRAR